MKPTHSSLTAILLGSLMVSPGCQSAGPRQAAPLQTTPIATKQPSAVSDAPKPADAPHEQLAAAPQAAPVVPVAATPQPLPSNSQTIARLSGVPITMDQIMPVMLEGYGLNILLNIVQLEATKQEASRDGISVTPDDVRAEMDYTLAKMAPDAEKSQYPRILSQFLDQKHISRAEFNLVVEANTYLRKMAAQALKDKITNDMVVEAFLQTYGEKVQLRHIELGNLQEVGEVQRMLAAGQPFEEVARVKSHNARTAPLGGELPAFTRSEEYDQTFKDAAFRLKEGEVSAPINVAGTYQILKLDKRIAPHAVKFEDVKDAVREDLTERAVSASIAQLRKKIAEEAQKNLVIDLKVLKDQYDARRNQAVPAIQNRSEISEEWQRIREAAFKAATQPSGASQPNPATAPSAEETSTPAAPVLSAPGVAQPPARQSGAPSGSGVSDPPSSVVPQ